MQLTGDLRRAAGGDLSEGGIWAFSSPQPYRLIPADASVMVADALPAGIVLPRGSMPPAS